MFIVQSNGVEQKFDSKVEALCVAAILNAFGYQVEIYEKINIVYHRL